LVHADADEKPKNISVANINRIKRMIRSYQSRFAQQPSRRRHNLSHIPRASQTRANQYGVEQALERDQFGSVARLA
jgi:hypothetical protein